MEIGIEKILLYARGFFYLFAAAQMLIIFLVMRPRVRAHFVVLGLIFVLSIGGLSSLANYPELGRWLITWVVTALLLVLNVFLTVYILWHK